MSTIVSSFVQDRASTKQLPTASLISGAVKAWIQFDGTGTPFVSASLNLASLQDTGLGNYTYNMTSPMALAAYAVSGHSMMYGVAWGLMSHQITTPSAWVGMTSPLNAPTAAGDHNQNSSMAIGNLA